MELLQEYENFGCLHEMFKRQALATPEKVAVVGDDGVQMTFTELDKKTDVLAKYLRIKGVTVDSTVGIYMERCVENVVAYIGILKAGGAYLPLDITYPKTLLEEIFVDSKITCIITNEDWKESITEQKEKVIVLGKEWNETIRLQNDTEKTESHAEPTLDSLAYVVYSSGTTGKPKGIMCPHRGSVFSYSWRHMAYPFIPTDRVACNVFFVWEMLRPLLKGIPLYVIPDSVIYDPPSLASFIKRNSITRILFTPSLLETVLDTDDINLEDFRGLRIVWFCGEVVTISLLARCIKCLPWIQFLNLYSISECHDVAVSNLSEYWERITGKIGNEKNTTGRRKFAPVGKVLSGVEVYILDDNMKPQPTGVAGEIYVGGPTLARGYLNRPIRNAERFIDRPAGVPQGKGKLYRTGDWGLMLANKMLEICGRCDSMVKIRGYSIETQAVEASLLEMSQVNACVVLAEGEEGTDKQLVAYVVPSEGSTKKEIRAALKHKLPIYMIPAYFIFLKRIPVLAASGKLDKRALPAARKSTSKESLSISDDQAKMTNDFSDDDDSPKTATERFMVEIWRDILQFPVTDVNESFFDLGGHSLLAARLLGKIRESFGINLTVKDLFTNSTISEISRAIDDHKSSDFNGIVHKEIDLENEVKLNGIGEVDLDIQLRAFWRSATYSHRWRTGRVLLTGATGFLGAYLLRDLLVHTKTQVYCLVRKSPNIDTKERLRNALNFYKLLKIGSEEKDERLLEDFNHRVHAIVGDVALLELGLSEDEYTYLSYEIDFVIHAAAYVNLLYPYEALKGTNVFGTRNVLYFATLGKIKPVHYISTNSVFPNHMKNCKEISSKDHSAQLRDGYSQSKWVAEQLVMNAIESGLPASIYRLGNLSGDRVTAGWNPSDFILLVLRASLEAGVWPNITWRIECTPVDFVSRSVIGLSQNLTTSIHKIFHIVNPNSISSQTMYQQVKACGYNISKVSFDEWCESVASLREQHSQPEGHPSPKRMLDSVVESRNKTLFSFDTTFDQTVFNGVLKNYLIAEYPKITKDLIKTYLKKLAKRNVIKKPGFRLLEAIKKCKAEWVDQWLPPGLVFTKRIDTI